jgi:hypothetical protein
MDAEVIQFWHQATTDAPDLADLDLGQLVVQLLRQPGIEVAHPILGIAFLRAMVGQLGQGLAGSDAYTYRQASVLPDFRAHLAGDGQVRPRHPSQIQEAFIDAVHLLMRAEVSQELHDAVAHVGVELIVR